MISGRKFSQSFGQISLPVSIFAMAELVVSSFKYNNHIAEGLVYITLLVGFLPVGLQLIVNVMLLRAAVVQFERPYYSLSGRYHELFSLDRVSIHQALDWVKRHPIDPDRLE